MRVRGHCHGVGHVMQLIVRNMTGLQLVLFWRMHMLM